MPLRNATTCILETTSWLYRTSIFFLVCVLFDLICSLQIARFQEHLRIRRQLRIINHRYWAFILSALIIVTASQVTFLLRTTRANANVNVYRAGELLLCSVTFIAGFSILLRSATKITQKVQPVTCLDKKWHIFATLDSFDNNDGESPTAQVVETDDDSADGDDDDYLNNTKIIFPAYTHTISFQIFLSTFTQSLIYIFVVTVLYFENSLTGIRVFGVMLDTTLLNTIFGIEMSLMLWLLGQTIGF